MLSWALPLTSGCLGRKPIKRDVSLQPSGGLKRLVVETCGFYGDTDAEH